MPTIRATVHRTSEPLGLLANHAVRAALHEAATVGAGVSRRVAQQRPGPTGEMQNITVSEVRGTAHGWEVEVTSHAPWAWFQEFGTLGNRKRKLKQPSRSTEPSGHRPPGRGTGSGITPLRFLSAGASAARKAFLPLLEQKLR